jgi:hypothetical protein
MSQDVMDPAQVLDQDLYQRLFEQRTVVLGEPFGSPRWNGVTASHAWADRSHESAWYRFVERALPRQLELFGFPPPGHPFWTAETLAAVKLRYPGLDMTTWHANRRT